MHPIVKYFSPFHVVCKIIVFPCLQEIKANMVEKIDPDIKIGQVMNQSLIACLSPFSQSLSLASLPVSLSLSRSFLIL